MQKVKKYPSDRLINLCKQMLNDEENEHEESKLCKRLRVKDFSDLPIYCSGKNRKVAPPESVWSWDNSFCIVGDVGDWSIYPYYIENNCMKICYGADFCLLRSRDNGVEIAILTDGEYNKLYNN